MVPIASDPLHPAEKPLRIVPHTSDGTRSRFSEGFRGPLSHATETSTPPELN